MTCALPTPHCFHATSSPPKRRTTRQTLSTRRLTLAAVGHHPLYLRRCCFAKTRVTKKTRTKTSCACCCCDLTWPMASPPRRRQPKMRPCESWTWHSPNSPRRDCFYEWNWLQVWWPLVGMQPLPLHPLSRTCWRRTQSHLRKPLNTPLMPHVRQQIRTSMKNWWKWTDYTNGVGLCACGQVRCFQPTRWTCGHH